MTTVGAKWGLLSLLLMGAGCGVDDSPLDSADRGRGGKSDSFDAITPFGGPADCGPAPEADAVWDRPIASGAVTLLGDPHHGTADAVTNPGASVAVSGRFVYSLTMVDLERETVELWLESGDCAWSHIADVRTDDDGVATFELGRELMDRQGAYNFEMIVRGDDSRVRGAVWVVEPGTDAVVFDIDGTMTTSDREFVEEFL